GQEVDRSGGRGAAADGVHTRRAARRAGGRSAVPGRRRGGRPGGRLRPAVPRGAREPRGGERPALPGRAGGAVAARGRDALDRGLGRRRTGPARRRGALPGPLRHGLEGNGRRLHPAARPALRLRRGGL
ncbi:MAG: hypothetical protein AVDCRST_MAG48-2552, partial [uncultured Friedmanniella sp.]